MSFGKNKSTQSSVSTQQSQSQNLGSNVWGPQQDYLKGQWGDANATYNQQVNNNAGWGGYEQNANALNQAYGATVQGMGQLSSPYMNQAQQTFSNMQNPGVDPMLGVYARQIGQQFNEQIKPGLQGQAAMAGGLGNSRAQIGEALAGARAGQQIQDFGAQLYGQGQDRALNAANMAGGLAGNIAQGYGQFGDQFQNIGQGQMQNAQFGMAVPWYAAQQRAGLLGGPIMQDLGGTSSASGSSTGSQNTSGFNFKLW
jgi:hypothetical protein